MEEISVDGLYLEAKMLHFVAKTQGTEPELVKKTQSCKARKTVSMRVQTNKKSRSQFKMLRLAKNFHFYMMYKAALEPSKRIHVYE